MELTERYRQYSSLVRRHERLIVMLSLRHGSSDTTPDDLAQEVRIGLWHHFKKLENGLPRWKESVWVYWYTRSVLSHHSHTPAPDLVSLNDAMLNSIAAEDDRAAAIIDELAECLPADDRRLLDLLRQGYNCAEIAALEGMADGTVRQRRRMVERLRQPLEDLVVVDALVLADTQGGGIHVGDACAFPKTEHLQHDGHRESLLLHQFHEAVVRHGLWELALHVLAHIVDIEVLEVAECTVVEQYHDGDYFSG